MAEGSADHLPWTTQLVEALADDNHMAVAWGRFESYLDSFDQGLLALLAVTVGAALVARGFAVMKPFFVLAFSLGLALRTSAVAIKEGQGMSGAVASIVVGVCALVFAHRVYPLFVFFLGCLIGGGLTFVCRVPLGLSGQPAGLIGLMMLVSVFVGLAMKQFRVLSWRVLTPLVGGLLAAATIRYWAVSLFADGGSAFWLDFARIPFSPEHIVTDPLEVFLVVTWGVAACLGWYSQLLSLLAGVDPLALPDGIALRLQQAEKFCPFFFDGGEEFSSKLLPASLLQERTPFLTEAEKDSEDLEAQKEPDYRPEGVVLAMLASVLMLNLFMLGKPLLFLGHVVLMSVAFQAFMTASLMSYATPNRILPGLAGSNSPLLRHFTHATFNILVLFCAIGGFLCMYGIRAMAHKSQLGLSPQSSWIGTAHVWTGYVTLALLFVMTFSGAAKMFAGLTLGDADSVAKFHSHLGKTLYGFAGINQLFAYFMPNLLPLWGSILLTVVLVASTAATIYFLNSRSPETVKRMKRFGVEFEAEPPTAWHQAPVATKDTKVNRSSFASTATTRIDSMRSIARNSSIASAAGAGMLGRTSSKSFDWDAILETFEAQDRRATVSLYFTHWHRHTQSAMIVKAQADLEGSNNLVNFLSSALVEPAASGEP